jgi:hypothetical protein
VFGVRVEVDLLRQCHHLLHLVPAAELHRTGYRLAICKVSKQAKRQVQNPPTAEEFI